MSDQLAELLAAYGAELAPYRNAVYLWLRIAGVAWIAVEFVAAFLLWRGHFIIRAALKAQERRP